MNPDPPLVTFAITLMLAGGGLFIPVSAAAYYQIRGAELALASLCLIVFAAIIVLLLATPAR